MKNYLLFFLLIFMSLAAVRGQSIFTVGEVYDFNVNDEFHVQWKYLENPVSPPNVNRSKIIGKYFSADNDTVFYFRAYNNYLTTYVSTPPHLEYEFFIGVDTFFYTHLDSLVKYEIPSELSDSCSSSLDSIYNSTWYGNQLIYDHQYKTGCIEEEEYFQYIYAKGLGRLSYTNSFLHYFYQYTEEVFYFKKDSIEWGTPDTLMGIPSPEIPEPVRVFPNPVADFLQIENVHSATELRLYELSGKVVLTKKIPGSTSLDIRHLEPGFYIFTADNRRQKWAEKISIIH